MADIKGVVGARCYITDAAIASTIDTEEDFTAQSWTEISLIDNFGDFGRVFQTVNFEGISDGRTRKLKGFYNDGAMSLTMGLDLSDAGQVLLKTAAEGVNQDNYGFRIEFNDAPSSYGGGTTFFFRGLCMEYRATMGGGNSVIHANSNVEVNSSILRMPPAELYDTFPTGDTLSAWHLFNGSDAQAADPVVSAGTMVLVSGDVAGSPPGTFDENGSQAIYDTGFTLSDGPVVIEARIKISAITNTNLFFGLTDQKAALEVPIESASSGNTITTNATDAVGFMFDTEMTADTYWLVGVNNSVDETAQNTALAPVANTYKTLRIEVAANGDAAFFMDGVAVGTTMTTAAATGVALYPTVAVSARSTASRTGTVDFIYARQD